MRYLSERRAGGPKEDALTSELAYGLDPLFMLVERLHVVHPSRPESIAAELAMLAAPHRLWFNLRSHSRTSGLCALYKTISHAGYSSRCLQSLLPRDPDVVSQSERVCQLLSSDLRELQCHCCGISVDGLQTSLLEIPLVL